MAPDLQQIDPGSTTEEDVLLAHSQEYLEAVKTLSGGGEASRGKYGFGSGDNPDYPGMHEAALAYSGASSAGARALIDGEPLAVSIMGGLHHARKSEASGFCIYCDPAISVAILRERFDRVLYVDIDLHHGDGVQWIHYNDPDAVTYSIHQDGRSLYPGTGGPTETGQDFSSINIPLPPRTSGRVWLKAFRHGLNMAVERSRPQAIVLQMGCDAHILDPLGHLEVRVQDWLQAIRDVQDLNVPLLVLGGGGYHLGNVVRMWSAAVMGLFGLPFKDEDLKLLPAEWGAHSFHDDLEQEDVGEVEAEAVFRTLKSLAAQ